MKKLIALLLLLVVVTPLFCEVRWLYKDEMEKRYPYYLVQAVAICDTYEEVLEITGITNVKGFEKPYELETLKEDCEKDEWEVLFFSSTYTIKKYTKGKHICEIYKFRKD